MHHMHTFLSSEPISCRLFPVSASSTNMTTGVPTTEPLPPTVASVTPKSNPTTMPWLRTRRLNSNECFRYVHGTFTGNITIIGRWEAALFIFGIIILP